MAVIVWEQKLLFLLCIRLCQRYVGKLESSRKRGGMGKESRKYAQLYKENDIGMKKRVVLQVGRSEARLTKRLVGNDRG